MGKLTYFPLIVDLTNNNKDVTMLFKKMLSLSVLLLSTLAITPNAFAWTAVASSSSKDYAFIVYGVQDAAKAKELAIEGCNERSGTNDCSAFLTATGSKTIVALVSNNAGGWFASSREDLDEAISVAMKNCKKESSICTLKNIAWDGVSPFAAIASFNGEMIADTVRLHTDRSVAMSRALEACKSVSPTPEKCTSNFFNDSSFIAYSEPVDNAAESYVTVDSSKEIAEKNSLKNCNDLYKKKCKIVSSFQSGKIMPVPKNVQKKMDELEAIKKAKNQAPKPTPVALNSRQSVTCHNDCINGNCVRTFSDGRKERWQAPRVYNGFTNSWDFDITTNACGL